MRGLSGLQKVAGVLIISVSATLISPTASSGNMSEYTRIAQYTIEQAQKGQVSDVDQLLDQQAKLVQLGVDACNQYVKKHPKAKPILELVTSNAEMMKQLSLTEIEEKWHHGGEFKKRGYSVKEDHFGAVANLIDAVIHPATSFIALSHYKRDNNPAHLQQVVAELSEVLVHIQQLD